MEMNRTGFALQIVNTPDEGAGQGSAINSLRSALTGASAWRPESYTRAKPAGEAVYKKRTLYNRGILMEDEIEDAKFPGFNSNLRRSTPRS